MDLIGTGASSFVYVGIHKLIQKAVAIKITSKATFTDEYSRTRMMREIALMKNISHPLVTSFFELIEDDNYLYIVMEYIDHGSLQEHIRFNGKMMEQRAKIVFAEIIYALSYLHDEKQIVHRDIKPDNILIDKNSHIRIIDFGLSNIISNEKQYLTTPCGSPATVSPEMIKGMKYTESSDIWSLGILLYFLVYGEYPFIENNLQDLMKKIVTFEPIYPSFFSHDFTDLLNGMLQKNPNERFKIQQIIDHPWFYKKYLDLMISFDHRKYEVMNQEIIDLLKSYGIDVNVIEQDLKLNLYNEKTAVYRILVCEMIHNEFQRLNSINIYEMMKANCEKTPPMIRNIPLAHTRNSSNLINSVTPPVVIPRVQSTCAGHQRRKSHTPISGLVFSKKRANPLILMNKE